MQSDRLIVSRQGAEGCGRFLEDTEAAGEPSEGEDSDCAHAEEEAEGLSFAV
jgi:hypothetical protein